MKKSWLSVLTADDSSSRWVQRAELFHDDDLDQQPDGQVGLYLSDFLGAISLPASFCRPSALERAIGVSRFVFPHSISVERSIVDGLVDTPRLF